MHWFKPIVPVEELEAKGRSETWMASLYYSKTPLIPKMG